MMAAANNSHFHPLGAALIDKITSQALTTFAGVVEQDLLALFTEADAEFVSKSAAAKTNQERGDAEGANRATKAFYANEILKLLLEKRTGKTIGARGKRSGLAFAKHDVDLVHPEKGDRPFAVGEVKIAGTPAHSGNQQTSKTKGRELCKDLDKRAKEIVCASIDLKRKWRTGAPAHIPDGVFYVTFYFGRAADARDAEHAREKLLAIEELGGYVDSVGLFFYENGSNDAYVAVPGSAGHTMDDALAAFAKHVI